MLLLLSLISSASGWYLPGVAPVDYRKGDQVQLLVNPLDSQNTAVPLNYYDPRFHFCADNPQPVSENIGSILLGDRLFTSPLRLQMRNDTVCNSLCTQKIPAQDAAFINQAIRDSYRVKWLVDGLPAAQLTADTSVLGFALGSQDGHFNNHYSLKLSIHEENNAFRVVGFVVEPSSRQRACHADDKGMPTLEESTPLALSTTTDTDVTFSYSVTWTLSSTPWGTRWDHYLTAADPRVHWFSIVNSLLIVFFLAGLVGIILVRSIHRDLARYNKDSPDDDDISEDFGWKLVHGDVFRTPPHRQLLCVLVGNGFQLFGVLVCTLGLAALGLVSPASRGSLPTVMLVCYLLFGGVAGYVSTRMYKMLGGETWRQTVLLTAMLIPGYTNLNQVIICRIVGAEYAFITALFVSSSTVWHAYCSSVSLATSFPSALSSRCVFRIQAKEAVSADTHTPDSAPDPTSSTSA